MPPIRTDRNNRNDRNERNDNRNNMNQLMPMTPPPSRVPERPFAVGLRGETRAVNPGSIRNCLGRFTYVWLSNGQEFWIFPIRIWGNTVAGFRWDRRFGWSYTGVSLNRVDMFTCSA